MVFQRERQRGGSNEVGDCWKIGPHLGVGIELPGSPAGHWSWEMVFSRKERIVSQILNQCFFSSSFFLGREKQVYRLNKKLKTYWIAMQVKKKE